MKTKDHKREAKRIYDLLNEEFFDELPKRILTVEDIRDIAMVNLIYDYYLKRDMPKVVWHIKEYDDFEFFKDLAVYLKDKYKNRERAHEIYQEFLELYY